MKTLGVYSSNVPMCDTCINSHVVDCIPGTDVSYNSKFVSFDHLHPIPHPPTPTSDNHKCSFQVAFLVSFR